MITGEGLESMHKKLLPTALDIEGHSTHVDIAFNMPWEKQEVGSSCYSHTVKSY